MKTQTYAAIDIGAESGRVIAGTFDGQILHLEEIHRFPNTPARVGNTLCWDVLRLWNDIGEGLSKLAGRELAGIGVDTWGVDFGLLDKNDELLGNPVHYRDARTENYEDAFQTVPKSEIAATTGLAFMYFNTLYQLLALKRQNSSALCEAKTLLYMPDLLHFWLCNVKANEYSIASTGQLLDAKVRGYSQELLSKFGLPDIFPPIVEPGTKLGTLRPDVAARLGISPDTPVIAPGSHDTASAVAAAPGEGENWAYLSSGTWSLMGLELHSPLISPATGEANFTNEGGVCGTIRFLKNIAGLWLVQECRRAFLREGNEYSYAELTHMAREAPALRSLFEPDDARFAAPVSMPDEIAGWCRETGQPVPETPGQYVRCCLESLALKYRWTLEKLEALRESRIDTLHIVGGGTQNTLLNQFAADALNRRVVTGPVEATAAGNILTQALGNGELKNLDEVRAVIRNSFELQTYVPGETGPWDEAYARFLAF